MWVLASVMMCNFILTALPLQGQQHGKQRPPPEADEDSLQSFRSGSPSVPGSPLTFSPQVPMEPLGRTEEESLGQTEFAGWAAQPKLVPTVFAWSHGGNYVELEGSFDNWSQRHTMQRAGRDCSLVKLLPPGVYQYKFIVDGQWRHDPNLAMMYDDMGNINNVLEVQEYAPENLDGLSCFDPPPSPRESYNCPLPIPEDFQKEPPIAPPQLQLSLLNVPPALDAVAALPRPQHVVLNHAYCLRGTSRTTAIVLGTTHRYRSKYITTVLYKPRRGVGARAAAGGTSMSMQGGAGFTGYSQGADSQLAPMQH